MLKGDHKAAKRCHICLKEFNGTQNKKVRDHCHYTSLCRGAAHNNNGNLKYWIQDYIPSVFNKLSGYDAHFFIKEQGRKFNKNDIGVISENKEKKISFNVKINRKLAGLSNRDGTEVLKNIHLRFIDNCRFMASSLDNLASNLCGTSEVKCGKCRNHMELIKVSGKYTSLFRCGRCRTKEIKDLDERVLRRILTTPLSFGDVMKICPDDSKRHIPI